MSDDEYQLRSLGRTPVCMKDSGRLIDAADHDSNKTDPCNDFKTLAMGHFFKHRVLNDRYDYLGFDLDVYQQFWEKQKLMLLKPIGQNETKMFRVMKSFFRKCINSSKFFLIPVLHGSKTFC